MIWSSHSQYGLYHQSSRFRPQTPQDALIAQRLEEAADEIQTQYWKSLYPEKIKKIQQEIEHTCDELDYAGAGMNPNETGELMDMIRFVRDEFHMTILLIEHDMKLVSGICEELTVLNFGEVLAQGKTTDVLNDPQVIKAYLGE